MKELRCLVFTDREVVGAVIDRRRKRHDRLPSGSIGGVSYSVDHGIETRVRLVGDDGGEEEMVFGEAEVLAALLAHCMARKIPLPAESDKFLYLVNDRLALMITMNFNRQPRMVVDGAEGEGRHTRLHNIH